MELLLDYADVAEPLPGDGTQPHVQDTVPPADLQPAATYLTNPEDFWQTYPQRYQIEIPVPARGKTQAERAVGGVLGNAMEGSRVMQEAFWTMVFGFPIDMAGTKTETVTITPDFIAAEPASWEPHQVLELPHNPPV